MNLGDIVLTHSVSTIPKFSFNMMLMPQNLVVGIPSQE